jgi:uncharacterized protein YndB with AHSA1/START domain
MGCGSRRGPRHHTDIDEQGAPNEKLNFSTVIAASREKVWDAMVDEKAFREWTSAFAPGSHYVGDWSAGSKMLFLAPGEDGKEGGMVSRVREHRPREYISVEHLGVVQDGVEDTSGDKGWSGALENYTLRDVDGGTEVLVEMDTEESFAPMFEATWPQALQKLKALAER